MKKDNKASRRNVCTQTPIKEKNSKHFLFYCNRR